jgi:hypothetical protein
MLGGRRDEDGAGSYVNGDGSYAAAH